MDNYLKLMKIKINSLLFYIEYNIIEAKLNLYLFIYHFIFNINIVF